MQITKCKSPNANHQMQITKCRITKCKSPNANHQLEFEQVPPLLLLHWDAIRPRLIWALGGLSPATGGKEVKLLKIIIIIIISSNGRQQGVDQTLKIIILSWLVRIRICPAQIWNVSATRVSQSLLPPWTRMGEKRKRFRRPIQAQSCVEMKKSLPWARYITTN